MRVIRPMAWAMADAIEKANKHPVAKHVSACVGKDSNYGVQNTYAVRINAPKELKIRDFQI